MSIEQERQAHYHTLIAIHRANLERLEEQEARHGMAVPLEIASGIAYERDAIQKLTLAMGSLMPASVVEELGPEGRFLVTTKMLEGQNAWNQGRAHAEREERMKRQRHNDLMLYLILAAVALTLAAVVIDILLRFL